MRGTSERGAEPPVHAPPQRGTVPPQACTPGAGTPSPACPQPPLRASRAGAAPRAQPQRGKGWGVRMQPPPLGTGGAPAPRLHGDASPAPPPRLGPGPPAAPSTARPAAGEEARPRRLIPAEGGALTFGGAALSRPPPSPVPRCRCSAPHAGHSREPIPHLCPGRGSPELPTFPGEVPPRPLSLQPSKVGLSAIGPGNMLFIGAAAPALPLEASFSSLGLITFPLIDPSLGGKIPRSVVDSGWTQKKPRAGRQRA